MQLISDFTSMDLQTDIFRFCLNVIIILERCGWFWPLSALLTTPMQPFSNVVIISTNIIISVIIIIIIIIINKSIADSSLSFFTTQLQRKLSKSNQFLLRMSCINQLLICLQSNWSLPDVTLQLTRMQYTALQHTAVKQIYIDASMTAVNCCILQQCITLH